MATSVTKNRKFDKNINNKKSEKLCKVPIASKLWVWLIPFYI
jgi:hypothetical protein